MIEVVGVFKSFGEHEVLKNVNMTFEDGRIYCLMGESGVGKTTLLRIIMGLEAADEGEVRFNGKMCDCQFGREASENAKISRDIAVVFQEDRLLPDRTPIDNVYFVTKGQKQYSAKPEIKEAMSAFLPTECLSKRTDELSGGMKRRVALARAMLSDKKILLLDEPFTGLDEEARAQAAEFIKKHQSGRTVVVVTHEKGDAERLGANICLLTMVN
jgi:NitT/TauT family transport system ATP-binding protein